MAYQSMLMNQRAGVLNEQPLVTGRDRSEQEVYDDHATGPTSDVYGKGSLVIHTLRELIGDKAFFETVRLLVYGRLDPKPGNFTSQFRSTADYVAIVNHVTGRDYGWFFDAYLREAALPHLETHRSGDVLSLEWRVPGNRPFPMPVEVKVGDRMETVPMADGHGRLTILAGETAITLDPRSKILRKLDGIDRFQRWRKASSAPAAGAR